MLSMPASFPKFQDASTRSGAGSAGPEPIFTLPFSAREAQASSKQAAIPDPKMGKGEFDKDGSEGVNAWRKHGGRPPWRTGDDHYADPKHPLFLKVLQDPSVKEILITKPDGTYDYDHNPRRPYTWAQGMAAALIRAQNNARNGTFPDRSLSVAIMTEGDIIHFKKLTGYNLVNMSGGNFCASDDGKPVAPEDHDRVHAMWRVFIYAAASRNATGGGPEDLTLSDLKGTAQTMLSSAGLSGDMFNVKILRSLLDLLDKAIDKEKQDLDAAKNHAAQNSAAQSLNYLGSGQPKRA